MNKPNYSSEVQRLYLEMFLSDAETFVRCQSIFDPENFDRKLKDPAAFILDYVDKYKVMPELDIVNTSCETNFKIVNDLPPENYDWLLDEFETFSRHKALERAIIKSADLLDKGEFGPVEIMIKEAVQISLNKDMGTDYFEDPRARLMGLKDKNGQVSTGWPTFDKKLFGGFNRGELNIFAGGSGAGKSLFLQNLAINFSQVGLNVLYVSLELSEALVCMRLDSMITGLPTREIFKSLDDVELKVRVTGKNVGGIQVKYMPSGKNINDLRAYIKEYQVKRGHKPDVVLIDYLDLMMPVSIKISPSDLFVKDKYVSEEIRNFAMESKCVCVTASQLNRSAVEEIEFDHSHISGGLSKIQTADNVIGIFTSRAMRERGRYQIQFMKTRSSSAVGQKLDLDFNLDSLRITDPGEEEDGSQTSFSQGGGRSSSGASNILNGLKKTSTVIDSSTGEINREPDDGLAAPKIRGKADSSRIRDMLANINSERD
jgi:KaiC/GvpD/RAD55 family RecA-like ATPase